MLRLALKVSIFILANFSWSALAGNCNDVARGQIHLDIASPKITCPNPGGAKQTYYCDGKAGGRLMQVDCSDEAITFTNPADTPNSSRYLKKKGAFEEVTPGEEFKFTWQEANGYDTYVPSNFAWEALYKFSNGGRSLSITTTMSTREKLYIESSPFKPGTPFTYEAVLCDQQPN